MTQPRPVADPVLDSALDPGSDAGTRRPGQAALSIENLTVQVEDKCVLRDLCLELYPGELVALMGPNGSGKTSLLLTLAGHPAYECLAGRVRLGETDLMSLPPHVRSRRGLFLSFQTPVGLEGVTAMNFLCEMMTAQEEERARDENTPETPLPSGSGEAVAPPAVAPPRGRSNRIQLVRAIREKAAQIGIPSEMLTRPVNVGFSGGEKKRFDLLQLALLEPSVVLLDEMDSGLDVDSMKKVLATLRALRHPDRVFLVVSHYRHFVENLEPDRVCVLVAGTLERIGGLGLVTELERRGYAQVLRRPGIQAGPETP